MTAVELGQLDWIRAEVADLREYELSPAGFDGAICRWLLMFVAGAEQIITRVAAALRRGAVFAVMEYVNFRSMSLWPDGPCFARVYSAVHDLIAQNGGDADIGGRVPDLLERAGFEIVELLPVWRAGRQGSPLWEWLDATGQNHPNLVKAGLLTDAELQAYYREWRTNAANPSAFFTAPPVLATIARKR